MPELAQMLISLIVHLGVHMGIGKSGIKIPASGLAEVIGELMGMQRAQAAGADQIGHWSKHGATNESLFTACPRGGFRGQLKVY
jgi:hypothetical protein